MDASVAENDLSKWWASSRVLAGTGHRPDKINKEYELDGPYIEYLKKQLVILFSEIKPAKVISGMALGFDQLLAIVSIEHEIPVLAAIPCDDQERIWPKKSQQFYNKIMSHSLVTPYVVTPGPYHAAKMQIRNRWMCDNADGLVAAWDGSSGGTANCLKYARELDMLIWYLKFPEEKKSQLSLF